MGSSANDKRAARVERFLRRCVGQAAWSPDDAVRDLGRLFDKAAEGEAQRINTAEPLVLISVNSLRRILLEATGPENWGEIFALPYDRPGGIGELELAPPRSTGRVSYDLDDDYSDVDVTEENDGKE